MNTRTTLILLALVIALGALILGIERYLPSTREMLEMKRGPLRFKRDEVTRIEIDSEGGDAVALAMEGGMWRVEKPFGDLADPAKVLQLIDALKSMGWIERVHQDQFDAEAWRKTQIEKPLHKIRLFADSRQIADVHLGAPTPMEGTCYLALQPAPGTLASYVVRTSLLELLKAAPAGWRDMKLLRIPAQLVTRIHIAHASGQIELERAGEKAPWSLSKPLAANANKERVQELLSTLLNLEIVDAMLPTTAPAGSGNAPTAASGIDPDTLKITVTLDGMEDSPFTAALKKPAKDQLTTTATTEHRKPVFTVSSKSLGSLWAQPNELRDRMLARIDPDEVTGILITSSSFPQVELKKEADSWFLRRHGELVPANGGRLARMFDDLNNHEIREFTADTAANLEPFGLTQPFQTVEWTRADGVRKRLLLGRNTSSTEFYAKYEDEPSVCRIDASLLPSIPQDGIKWKGLGLLRFTQFALRRISLSAGAAPPVNLDYDPTTAEWTGSTAERDITPLIDRVKADRTAGLLAKLNVQDWVGDRTEALLALKTPVLRIQITLGEPGRNDGPTRDIVLTFAPTQPGAETAFYFGQMQPGRDVFYISRATLRQIFAPPLKEVP